MFVILYLLNYRYKCTYIADSCLYASVLASHHYLWQKKFWLWWLSQYEVKHVNDRTKSKHFFGGSSLFVYLFILELFWSSCRVYGRQIAIMVFFPFLVIENNQEEVASLPHSMAQTHTAHTHTHQRLNANTSTRRKNTVGLCKMKLCQTYNYFQFFQFFEIGILVFGNSKTFFFF